MYFSHNIKSYFCNKNGFGYHVGKLCPTAHDGIIPAMKK